MLFGGVDFSDCRRGQKLYFFLSWKRLGLGINIRGLVVIFQIAGRFCRMTVHGLGLDYRTKWMLVAGFLVRLVVGIDWDLIPSHIIRLFLGPTIEVVLVLRSVKVCRKGLVLVAGSGVVYFVFFWKVYRRPGFQSVYSKFLSILFWFLNWMFWSLIFALFLQLFLFLFKLL